MDCRQSSHVVETKTGFIHNRLPVVVMAMSMLPLVADSALAQSPPIAEDQEYSMNTAGGMSLLANAWADSGGAEDPNGIDYSSVEIVTQPLHGTLQVDPQTGNASYIPDEGYYGYDGFSYRFHDLWGAVSNTASVLLWINDPPVITGFRAVNAAINVWYVEGTVQDSTPEGLTVTLGGILEGITVTTTADGSFGYSFTLGMGGGGPVTAQTVDPEGLSSNIAEAIVFE